MRGDAINARVTSARPGRETILAEIRRTAGENAGKALGMGRFQQETGIRPEDWEGRFWARWGDAIREAGLEPNTLQAPLDEDTAMAKLVDLIRALGHLPTRNEVMLAKRSDASIPSFTVYSRRFGPTQTQLAAKVLEYCGRHAGLEGVAEICATRSRAPAPSPRPERETADVLGAVYLFKSGRYYKIGRTNAAGRRERELAILMPEKGETVHAITTDDPAGIEAYWHHRFDGKRRGGEWFDLDPADVRAFKRRRFM